MHRLLVVLRGKSQNLLARDVARSERSEMTGFEIFEDKRCHDGDLLRGSLIVAVICGNLNPPTRMARARRANTAAVVLVSGLPGTPFGARPCAFRSQVGRESHSACRENH